MKFGLKKLHFNYILDRVVLPLKKKGASVYCFGSRAKDSHSKYSDLDLMVENFSGSKSEIFKIKESLKESNLPLKVDLVIFEDFSDLYRLDYQREKKLFSRE